MIFRLGFVYTKLCLFFFCRERQVINMLKAEMKSIQSLGKQTDQLKSKFLLT